jgi:alpha-soluble NSF attachment protein
VANFSLTSPLTKYNVKDYFLRIVLCTIATGDVVKAQKEYAEECVKDVTFAATREGKFAKELIDATDDGDIELYTQAIFEFDQVTKLDNWKTNILLMVKNKLEESEAELT